MGVGGGGDGAEDGTLWGGGGRERLSAGVYRTELSLDLKQSSDSAVTTSSLVWSWGISVCTVNTKKRLWSYSEH